MEYTWTSTANCFSRSGAGFSSYTTLACSMNWAARTKPGQDPESKFRILRKLADGKEVLAFRVVPTAVRQFDNPTINQYYNGNSVKLHRAVVESQSSAGGRGGHKEHPGQRGPEAVQLQHHGGHERLHRLGQQRHAGHGGRQLRSQDGGGPALPGHSGEDRAAGGRHPGGQRSPGGRHRRSAGLQACETPPSQGCRPPRRMPAPCLRPALGVDTSSQVDSKIGRSPGRRHHGSPGRRPPRQGGRQRAGLPALHGGRVGHSTTPR